MIQRRLIVDTDIGRYPMALLFLPSRPEVVIDAVGTVHGNVSAAGAAEKAKFVTAILAHYLDLCELVGGAARARRTIRSRRPS